MSAAKFMLRLCGFRPIPNGITNPPKKCVMIMAPHTAIFDFVLGKLMCVHLKLKSCIAIKKEVFFFPLGALLKSWGAVPVDREHARNVTEFAAKLLKEKEEIAYIICPEGTRKRVEKWKRGFYQIAIHADVPICLTHIDFRSRTLGIGQVFYPTGDYEKDMETIAQYYYGMRGIHKGQFNLEDKPYAHPEWLKK